MLLFWTGGVYHLDGCKYVVLNLFGTAGWAGLGYMAARRFRFHRDGRRMEEIKKMKTALECALCFAGWPSEQWPFSSAVWDWNHILIDSKT